MTSNDKQERVCLFCGRTVCGRSDKKYCDDNCRNNHHYRIKKNNTMVNVKIVDKILKRNREIIKIFNKRRRVVVSKQLLIDHNFDFEFVTKIYKTKKGTEYRMIYDYAYKFLNENEVLLLKFDI